MKLKTVIIDDEPIALEKIRKYVEKVANLDLVGAFDNAIDAIGFINDNEVNLIFTDINMPDLNGMEFAKSLRTPILVIFTTAYETYALESYKVSAVDYLLKPFSFADFQRATNKAIERFSLEHFHEPTASDSLFVKVDYRYVRLKINEIKYIKGCGEYLQLFIEGKSTPLMTLSSFQSMLERLPKNFIQIHRSYIVNIDSVMHIERNRVVMDSDTYLPISDGYKGNILNHLSSN